MSSTALTGAKVFKSIAGEQEFINCYNDLMEFWPVPYETMEIETEYGRCHVIVSGPQEGEPVLMLHGMTANSAMWYPTIEAVQNYRVHCVDAPGDFGKSVVLKPIRTSEDAVSWIDQLLAALQLETATFIGHSMGGWFCSNFAINRPERINRLLLLAPVATFMPIPFLKLLLKVYPAMLWPKPNRIRRAWNWFCSTNYTLPPHVMNLIIAAYTYGRSQLSVVPTVIEKEAWIRLLAPVLFLVGSQEKIYNADQVMKTVEELLPHAEIKEINDAGHCLIIEQKTAVNEAIRQFMLQN